jgi:site-specific DNA-methyltransferase (adenine-specific)
MQPSGSHGLPLNQVLQGDCIDILDTLPPASIDLVFADPPYNLQLKQELYRPNNTLVDAVNDAWDQFSSFQAYDDFTRRWLSACRRVLKDTGALWVIGTYHNIFRLGAIMQDLGFWFLNDVVWIKYNPMPNFRGVRFTNAHETLIWASKYKGARYTFNHHTMKNLNDDLQMRSDWYLPICTGEERIKENGKKVHSTQKPEALLYRILLSSSNPGDVVLDPFFGSGTTGAVAKKLQRSWIGIEREPHYVEIARQRIAAIQPGPDGDGFSEPPNRRRSEPRLPFGSLLENGLLQPGQALYFRRDRTRAAAVQAGGHLLMDGLEGSIHQLASRLLDCGPCNGWDLWFYETPDGQLHSIDELRQRLRVRRA